MAHLRFKEGLIEMLTMEFLNPNWQVQLENNNDTRHEGIWKLNQNQWVETPNIRRGGWSGVCKALLNFSNAGQQNVFIKRQENHFYRSLKHGLTNRSTFEREYTSIMQFEKLGIPTLDAIYFSTKKVDGKTQCILITKELEGYQSLEALYLPMLEKQKRRIVLESIALTMRKMHAHGYQHGNLYPKHIFVKLIANEKAETCFIDLEKTRKRLLKKSASIKDLGIFHRHLNHVSRSDRLRFFLTYRQEKKLSVASKKMLKTILLKKSK